VAFHFERADDANWQTYALFDSNHMFIRAKTKSLCLFAFVKCRL